MGASDVDAPADVPADPPAAEEPGGSLRELDLAAAGVTSIVWATGYRMDFNWILDAQFDKHGFPVHQGGVTPESGLYFVGLPWLTTRGSSFIMGVGGDAEKVVTHLASVTRTGAA